MTPKGIDLKAYWYKFLAQVLNLLTSKKFWTAAAAEAANYSLYASGKLTPVEFAGLTAGAAAAYILGVAHEDNGGTSPAKGG